MRRKIFVTLTAAEASALLELAQREYRDPRRQAALLLRDALIREGVLPEHAGVPNAQPAPDSTR